jgi:hypothetical protein
LDVLPEVLAEEDASVVLLLVAGAEAFSAEESAFGAASDLLSPFAPPFLAAPFCEEYRSEYQPPPFRMKFVPPLISRCAVAFEHLGHTSMGGAVMRWISSHWFPHSPHAYS